MLKPYFYDPDLRAAIETLLHGVQLPGQYIGGELGMISKRPEDIKGRFCFAFPDAYTIGMSHYGLQLLYSLMNKRTDWACERAFTPFIDMEHALRSNCLPLYSLETFTPLHKFDVVGFSLQYEMMYTNVLTMLFMGKIPIRRFDRHLSDPLVIAGGPCASNPEPMSRFIDIFVIGDGEKALPDVCDLWLKLKNELKSDFSTEKHRKEICDLNREAAIRREMILEIAKTFPFVYAPEFYTALPGKTPRPNVQGVPERIVPAFVADINEYEPSTMPIVPLVEAVQDRITVEIMRGCPGRCRFCQSSVLKNPIRKRTPEAIARIARESCRNTGINEVSLLSLSASDYPHFDELLMHLEKELVSENVTVSVPSLRVNHALSEVMKRLSTEKSSAVTIAPEAAHDEMRKRVAKAVTNENLLSGCRAAFENGFNRMKLYFMCGLPEETEADVTGIVQLSEEIAYLGKEIRGRFPTITANVSNFIPKPHTAFERCGMSSREYFTGAHQALRRTVRLKSVSVKYHSLSSSIYEALLSRGDRNCSDLIERVWKLGARLDAWTEYHTPLLWEQAIAEGGINVQQIVHTPYSESDELPWGHIDYAKFSS